MTKEELQSKHPTREIKNQYVQLVNNVDELAYELFKFVRSNPKAYKEQYAALNGTIQKITSIEQRESIQEGYVYGIDGFPYIILPQMLEKLVELDDLYELI